MCRGCAITMVSTVEDLSKHCRRGLSGPGRCWGCIERSGSLKRGMSETLQCCNVVHRRQRARRTSVKGDHIFNDDKCLERVTVLDFDIPLGTFDTG